MEGKAFRNILRLVQSQQHNSNVNVPFQGKVQLFFGPETLSKPLPKHSFGFAQAHPQSTLGLLGWMASLWTEELSPHSTKQVLSKSQLTPWCQKQLHECCLILPTCLNLAVTWMLLQQLSHRLSVLKNLACQDRLHYNFTMLYVKKT